MLAEKALQRDRTEDWVDWALEMMENGFEGEYLHILAGLTPPFYRSYTDDVVDRTLLELGLNNKVQMEAVEAYAYSLIDQALKEEITFDAALEKLKFLYDNSNMPKALQDFYLLYWAVDDLKENAVQFYWEGADAANIVQEIKRTFLDWKQAYELSHKE